MAMNTVVDKYCDATVTRHDNDTGKHRADLRNNCKNYMTSNRESTANRITWMVDDDGKNSNVYMIHFKDFVDDILKEYGI